MDDFKKFREAANKELEIIQDSLEVPIQNNKENIRATLVEHTNHRNRLIGLVREAENFYRSVKAAIVENYPNKSEEEIDRFAHVTDQKKLLSDIRLMIKNIRESDDKLESALKSFDGPQRGR